MSEEFPVYSRNKNLSHFAKPRSDIIARVWL